MSNIDPQNAQQIVQFLATYGTPAGIAAAQAVGTGAVQALGSGATKAIKSLWGKIRHKSEQEGGIASKAVTAFEAAPNDTEHQQALSFVLKQLCSADFAFAIEITQLFNEVQRDPVVGQFIQLISGDSQVGVAGVNYGHVTIQQTPHQPPTHVLEIDLSYAHLVYPQDQGVHIDRDPALAIYALNVGSAASYVNRIEFETRVDGHAQTNSLFYPVMTFASAISNKFREAIQPGQKHQYFYYLPDLVEFGTLGREVIPVAVLVFDEIKNVYRKPFTEEMSKAIMRYFRS